MAPHQDREVAEEGDVASTAPDTAHDTSAGHDISKGLLLVDLRGTIRAASPGLVARSGLAADALVGRSLAKLPAVLELLSDQAPSVLDRIAKASGESGGCYASCDASLPKEAGVVPLLSAGNEVREFAIRAVDSEDRADPILGTNVVRFFDLVRTIPQGVFYKDRDSVYLACNRAYAKDLGTTLDAIPGKTEFDFHPEALAQRFIEQDRRIIASGTTECSEAVHFDRGEEGLVYKVKTPVWDAHGGITGVLGILWDITDRTRRESHLRRIAELQTNSLDLFAHSIRDPLTVIQGYVSLLLRQEQDTDQTAMLQAIERGANQLLHITETFLNADRIEQAAWALETTSVSLPNLLNRTVERFAEEALRKGISITVQVEQGLLVNGDEQLLMEAVSCLLSNAIRYSDGGTITAALHRTVDDAVVSIADEGQGIPEEDIPHVFRKFYRATHHGLDVEGLGLGLALAKSIVESHGGSIAASSKVGEGSVFEIRIPLAPRPREGAATGV